MKTIGKLMLFFSSYFILFLILTMKEINNLPKPIILNHKYINTNIVILLSASIYLIMVFFSLISLVLFKKNYKFGTRGSKTQIIIDSISNGTSETVSYLLTIIIPLISQDTLSNLISTSQWLKMFSMVIILITVLLLYINSNMIVINPMIIISGYSLYKIQYHKENTPIIEGILISSKKFNPEDLDKNEISLHKMDTSIFMYRRLNNG